MTVARSLSARLGDGLLLRGRAIDGVLGSVRLFVKAVLNTRSINLGEVHKMYRKSALRSAAFVGAALLTTSLSFAQQPPTPPVAKALQEAAVPLAAGTLGVNTKTYSAIVSSAGGLRLGPAGSSASLITTGNYEVDFPSDVSLCVYTATIGTSPASFLAPAIVTVTPRSGNPNGIFVPTFSVTGTPENHPFNIHVQC